MSTITSSSGIREIASIISTAFERAGIGAVLSGGAAVAIYSRNRYQSRDLDFVTSAGLQEIAAVMHELGFRRQGRYFQHPESRFFVEFPRGPLTAGDELLSDWSTLETSEGVLHILSPTQCVMDRLAAYFHWKDPQALEQAVLVARAQPIDLRRLEDWSRAEGEGDKFRKFLAAMRQSTGNTRC